MERVYQHKSFSDQKRLDDLRTFMAKAYNLHANDLKNCTSYAKRKTIKVSMAIIEAAIYEHLN